MLADRRRTHCEVRRALWAALLIAGLLALLGVNPAAAATVSGTKTVSGTFVPGGSIAYTVVLVNTSFCPVELCGPGPRPQDTQRDNPGDEFTDVLPDELTLVNASVSSGTAMSNVPTNTVVWNGSIDPGRSVTITITATIKTGTAVGTVVSNTGTIRFDADGNGTNEAIALTAPPGPCFPCNPTQFTVVAPAVVSGRKTVSGTFIPDGTVVYTVVLSNNGGTTQADNPGNEFVDVLPAQLTLVSASASSGTAVANVGANTVTWNGSIPVSGSVTITIQAAINAPAPGSASITITNQGTITFDGDGNGTNESTTVTSAASFDLVLAIPTLRTTVFALLGLLLALTGFVVIRRRALSAPGH